MTGDEYVSAVPPSFEWQPLTAFLIQFDHQQPALTFVRISQYHPLPVTNGLQSTSEWSYSITFFNLKTNEIMGKMLSQ